MNTEYNIINIEKNDEDKIFDVIKIAKLQQTNLKSSHFINIKITYPKTQAILNKCFLFPSVLNNIIYEYIIDILKCTFVYEICDNVLNFEFFITGSVCTEYINFYHKLYIVLSFSSYTMTTYCNKKYSFFNDIDSIIEKYSIYKDYLSFINYYFYKKYKKRFFITCYNDPWYAFEINNPYRYEYDKIKDQYYCIKIRCNSNDNIKDTHIIRKIKNIQHLESSGKIIIYLNKKIKNIIKTFYRSNSTS